MQEVGKCAAVVAAHDRMKPNGENPLWYVYVKRNVDLFFIAGILGIPPPWFETKPKWCKALWRVYQIVTDLVLYTTTIANFVGAILLTDFMDFLASCPPLIHGIQISARAIILQRQKKEIKSYVEELDEVLVEDTMNPICRDESFQEIHAYNFKLNRKLTIFEFIGLILSTAVFLFPEFIKCFLVPEEAHVIIVSWYPYNASIARNKQITNTAHTIAWLIINFKMAAFDTLLQSLIILHASQFRQLRQLLGRIIPEGESRIEAFAPGRNQEIADKLRWWISQHQRSLSATKKLQVICSPLLLFPYMESLFNMCLCAFLATVESPWTPLQRFSAVFIVGTVFLQMYVFCHLGDYVTESSIRVTELGFSSTVFRCNRKIQKSVMMILKRMQFPVRFSALNLFQLDSKQYGVLVQGVFSYYMALRQLQSRN